MIIARRYTVEQAPGGQYYRIRNREAPRCPTCGALLSGYDHRRRNVINGDGASIRFQLRRLRCPACRCLHLEIPDFMEPQKHYSAQIIRQTVAGEVDYCPADNSTIRRWKKK